VAEERSKIFVVDDSLQDLRIHAKTLEDQDYEVTVACSGDEALLLVEASVPDLFLIHANMEGMDGYRLCERLKEDGRLLNVPVIFVTDSRSPEDIDRGYSAGGVDYIVKPCHLSEFLARVRTHIHLYQLLCEVERLREIAIDANPLTHLPGNNTIMTTIQQGVDQYLDVCVIYADLDNFKAYNDQYGFSKGDDLLLFTTETLHTALRYICSGEGFLGHVGGDDFVLVVPSNQAEPLGNEIIRSFDAGAPRFYGNDAAESGAISTKDRLGNITIVPLVSISLGGVHLRSRKFSNSIEVADVCAEVKRAAKNVKGSHLVTDRRQGEEQSKAPTYAVDPA